MLLLTLNLSVYNPTPVIPVVIKQGGDDVPRVIWEKYKAQPKDDTLDRVIQEAYDRITGKPVKTVVEVKAIVKELPLIQPIEIYDDEEDDIMMLLAAL